MSLYQRFARRGICLFQEMTNFCTVLCLFAALAVQGQFPAADSYPGIGINYGLLGDNLPPPTEVVKLYQKYKITKLRLFDPNHDVLDALRSSNIRVTLGVRNEDIHNLAQSQEAADSWFLTNVKPYLNDITFSRISVGNEVIPGTYAPYVSSAIRSLQNTLHANNLTDIKVATVVSTAVLGQSYPPSSGEFTPEASSALSDIVKFLSAHRSPLLINVYPYFAYAADPKDVPLDYAIFNATGNVVHDGDLNYSNLFDAIVDCFFYAIEKLDVTDIDLVVSETGWPSAGNGNFTTKDLASTYNKNLINHVATKGTPKKPDATIEAFIFALFNEDQKPPGVEQNFGLFYPTMEPVYDVFPTSFF